MSTCIQPPPQMRRAILLPEPPCPLWSPRTALTSCCPWSVLLYLGSRFKGPRGPCAAVSGAFACAELLHLAQAGGGAFFCSECPLVPLSCTCTSVYPFSSGLEIMSEVASRVCLCGHMPNVLPSYTPGRGVAEFSGCRGFRSHARDGLQGSRPRQCVVVCLRF